MELSVLSIPVTIMEKETAVWRHRLKFSLVTPAVRLTPIAAPSPLNSNLLN